MILWLFAIGVISMLGQVVLLRELNVAFYGSELIYILALGVWLVWTAAGAALGRRAHLPSPRRVRLLLLAQAWMLPACLVLIRDVRGLFGGVPGAYLPFPQQLLAMTLALMPIGLGLGLLFQWAAKLYVEERRSLAGAYAIESAGAMLGGVLATLFLMAGVQNFAAALLCALLSLAAACVAPGRGRRTLPLVAAAMALPLLAGLAWSGDLDRALTGRNHPFLVATRDSPYGRVTVTRAGGQLSVFENDALAFESEGTAAEEFVHLAALQRPAPRRVLVLGGGVEGLVRELLQHEPERIDYVELNPVLLDLLRPHLPQDVADSLRTESVRVVVADPRRFLDDAGRYDLILVGMPQPDSGQSNRFYTGEFFARCAERLEPGGVLAFRLRGAENLWTPQQSRRAGSIHLALRRVFRDTVVLPGVTNIILASDRQLGRDPAPLGARLVERGIRARLVIPAYIDYLYTNDRFPEVARLLERSRVPPNSDVRPVCYQYTLLLWLSRFYPAAALPDLPDLSPRALLRSPPAWAFLAALTALMLLSRRRPLLRGVLLAGVAGFAGMVLETVLILNYQVNRGVLYQDLGLLLTLFMAGLAAGSATMELCSRRCGGRWLATAWPGLLLLALLALLALATGWLIEARAVTGLAATAALLFGCGLLVAALFCYASLRDRPDQRRLISPLYSADLLGGAAGSLVASLLLIPAAGLAGAGLLVAAVTLLALLLA